MNILSGYKVVKNMHVNGCTFTDICLNFYSRLKRIKFE